MMTFETPTCPACGAMPTSILESVLGLASLVPVEGVENAFEYGDETTIDWDSQTPVRTRDRRTLNCGAHEWQTRLVREEPAASTRRHRIQLALAVDLEGSAVELVDRVNASAGETVVCSLQEALEYVLRAGLNNMQSDMGVYIP